MTANGGFEVEADHAGDRERAYWPPPFIVAASDRRGISSPLPRSQPRSLAWANATIEPKGRHNPHSTGKDTQQGGLPPPKTPRTVAEAIVEDYLELCRDPSRDILAWVNATMWDSPAGWRAQAPPLAQPPETAKTVAGGGGCIRGGRDT